MSANVPSPPRATISRRGILALLLVVLALDLTGFGWGLPHAVAPHVDDAAKPALDALRHGFLNETKYPKTHLMLLGAAYAPYLGWLYLTGGLQLGGTSLQEAGASVFADPAGSLTMVLLIARGVTVALHLGSVLLLYAVARRLVARPQAALFGAALWGLAPVVALFARSSNVDVPMCFWLAAALLQFLRVRERPTRGRLLALALIAVAGVCTKDQLVFALAPLALAVAVMTWRTRPHDRALAARDLALAAAVGLLAWALLSDLLTDPAQWVRRQAAWRADLANFVGIAAADVTAWDLARDALRDYVLLGSPALALATAATLLSCFAVRTRAGVWPAVLAVTYLVLALGWLGFEQPRYVMPAVLLGCLFVACRADALLAWIEARATPERRASGTRGVRAAGAALLLAAAAHAAQVAWALAEDPRQLAQAHLAGHVATETEVETYQEPNHLPGLNALGLRPAQTRGMTTAGVTQRAPPVIVLAADEAWRWSADQKRFATSLFDGLPGYTVARFGPEHGGRAPLWVDPTSPDRFWPNIVVLVRER